MSRHLIFDAIKDGDWRILNNFFEKKPECIHEITISRETVLMHLIRKEKWDVVEQVITTLQPDINAKDRYDRTALHFTCWKGHLPTIQLLLEKGLDVNLTTLKGNSPLLLSGKHRHVEVAKYLIQQGADVSQVNNQKDSLFEYIRIGECPIDPQFVLDHAQNLDEQTKKKYQGMRLNTIFR